MKDILGKEIVGYEEALYLKEAGFDGKCTGYYHYYEEGNLIEKDTAEIENTPRRSDKWELD